MSGRRPVPRCTRALHVNFGCKGNVNSLKEGATPHAFFYQWPLRRLRRAAAPPRRHALGVCMPARRRTPPAPAASCPILRIAAFRRFWGEKMGRENKPRAAEAICGTYHTVSQPFTLVSTRRKTVSPRHLAVRRWRFAICHAGTARLPRRRGTSAMPAWHVCRAGVANHKVASRDGYIRRKNGFAA